ELEYFTSQTYLRRSPMEPRQAEQNLELIRTLMERTVQYQLLTARAGLAAGCLACVGALTFTVLDKDDPRVFVAVWAVVFGGSLLATGIGSVFRSRERGERLWSRQARDVLVALTPSLVAAQVLTSYFFACGGSL